MHINAFYSDFSKRCLRREECNLREKAYYPLASVGSVTIDCYSFVIVDVHFMFPNLDQQVLVIHSLFCSIKANNLTTQARVPFADSLMYGCLQRPHTVADNMFTH